MEFPKMIYLGGEHGAAHRIVADEAEQDAAEVDGFLQVGVSPPLPPTDPYPGPVVTDGPLAEPPPASRAPDPSVAGKAELIAALEDAGIEHKKSWGVAKLREALDAKPE